MNINDTTPTNTRYLLNAVEAGLHTRPPHEIVAKAARPLRELIRRWWLDLEPEATAGVSIEMMEDGLVSIAQKAVTVSGQTVSRAWAKGSLNWKIRILQTDAEQVIAERFLVACERLGILLSFGRVIKFSHPSLLEIYLGLGLLAKSELPLEVRKEARVSILPLQTSYGRSTLAFLALADPQAVDELFILVANENLYLATWFLYHNQSARQTHGEWLANEILSSIGWDIDVTTRQLLQDSLFSLGNIAADAARRFIDERAGSLPGYFVAIALLTTFGNTHDVERLRTLLDERMLGYWEVERLRQLIREAEREVFDEDARKRYEKEEGVEIAKQTAILVLKTAGQIITRTSTPSAHWNHDTKKWVTGQGVKGAGSLVGAFAPSAFLQRQAALRELLAQLPTLIERRKGQIGVTAPEVSKACGMAVEVLSQRIDVVT